LLAERPFVPLRLHLADGRVREIRHPEMAMVAKTHVAIGVPSRDDSLAYERFQYCSIPNIVEVEEFDANDDKGNGTNGSKKKRGR
jgi:hypothetical protein